MIRVSHDCQAKEAKNILVGHRQTDRLYFIDQTNPREPEYFGFWQAPGTILYREPIVDKSTGYVAVPVQKAGASPGATWFVLAIDTSGSPYVVAEIPGLGHWGAMSYGVLFTSGGNGRIMAIDLRQAIENSGGSVPNSNTESHQCVPIVNPKLSINFLTINQGVERYLEDYEGIDVKGNIGPELREMVKYINARAQVENDFKWRKDVPLVGGRPAIFRVYASKGQAANIPAASIRLEVTGTVTETNAEGDTAKTYRTEVFESREGPKSLTTAYLGFGNVEHENVFTFEVTDREHFRLLGQETKIRVIVDTPGSSIAPSDIRNRYHEPVGVKFEYSEPMNIDLIPLDWINEGHSKSPAALSRKELETYKKELEQSIRAIMPITLCDDEGKERLSVHITIQQGPEGQENEPNTNPLITSRGVEFERPNSKSLESMLFPRLENVEDELGLLRQWYNKLSRVGDNLYNGGIMPYDENDPENVKIFKLLLMKLEPNLTVNTCNPNAGGYVAGAGFTGLWHMSVAYIDSDNLFQGELKKYDITTAVHELGHNLGSRHAPVKHGLDAESLVGFDVDDRWYKNMHFSGSPYYYGRIGVVGHQFDLTKAVSGIDVKAWWREGHGSLVEDAYNNITYRDIMGYVPVRTAWVSDRNFAQWWRYLKSFNEDEDEDEDEDEEVEEARIRLIQTKYIVPNEPQ